MPSRNPSATLVRIASLIRRLPAGEIGAVEAVVRDARQRVETQIEIDSAGEHRPCPHCGHDGKARWGRTRTGCQRWRCQGCTRTWCGTTASVVRGIHRPDLLLEATRDMFGDKPLSCRKLANKLGISRHTAWRWRMRVLSALRAGPAELLQGIVEADETFQRESRKGSREWVRHHRAPTIHPAPLRRRWHDYGRSGPPQAVAKAFQQAILGIADRDGRIDMSRLPDATRPSIAAALLPRICPDVFLLSDGAPQYQAIARQAGLGYWMLVAGRRSSRTPSTYHLNTVNGLHGRWKVFLRPFCGPATKNLELYARWFSRGKDEYLTIFRQMLA